MSAISSHFPEGLIRTRFTEYVIRFTRLASRYEEDAHGSTKFGYPSSSFSEGSPGYTQLGGGIVFTDDALGAKELAANASRIEGWRRTPPYQYLLAVRVCVARHCQEQVLTLVLRTSRNSSRRRPSKASTSYINSTVYGTPKTYQAQRLS